MGMVAIRGAITVDDNTEEAIKVATVELVDSVLKKNGLNHSDIVFMNFSATKDLTKVYPAKYVRTELGITDVPMMCYQEMNVEGSLSMCLRLLIVINTINNDFAPRHVYLKGASVLRPDLKN